MYIPQVSPRWTTNEEIMFLDKIGEVSAVAKILPKAKMLENYIAASMKRIDWGFMDKAKVLKHAADLLKKHTSDSAA